MRAIPCKMQTFTALVPVLLVAFSFGQCHYWLPAEGESCTELVRKPDRCEEPVAVTETVELVEDGFG